MNLQNKIAKIINIRDESTYPKISELKVADAILHVISEALPKEEDIYCGYKGKNKKQYRSDEAMIRNACLSDIVAILKGKK